MRVALLTYNAQAGDAIGNQVAEKLAFFLDRGADVRVFVESERRLHPAVRSHCRVLDPKPEGNGWEFLASADLVIVEYAQHYRLLELLPLLANGKPRVLFVYHGVTPANLWGEHNREALERGAQQRGLVWCADAALVYSRFTSQELRSQTAFPTEWLWVLGHPVDTHYFSPGRRLRGLREQLRLGDACLMLFVGRLAANKRVPVLIEALHRLRDRTPPVHLVIAGDVTDLYEMEADRCRQRAVELGLVDRVHLLGHLREDALLDAYRSADLFVMPSRHEGFCIPVIEAMACGLPVVAARAGALPETVAGAGRTFAADDPDDLARQVQRILGVDEKLPAAGSHVRLRLAVVAPRYGTDFVGGAESSLRLIAMVLHESGCMVEVFTTSARSNRDGTNSSPEGSDRASSIPVHGFPIDAHDEARRQEAVRAILQADGHVAAETERLYRDHSLRSTRLVEALRQRIDHFDAVIVGPYLCGLALDVALAFPSKTLLVPCFHDEPFARLEICRQAYRDVGGILYHSEEEKDLAEVELGLNHPGAVCIGTFVDVDSHGDAEHGRTLVGAGPATIVYCGRYLREKNLPLLLDYAQRYHEAKPGRFRFIFLGEGEVSIPHQPWACDLGFVDEVRKRDILAAAAILVQLSRNESLSLVALEAWAQSVPVLAAADCAVLAGHLRRSGGGRTVAEYASFAAALDDLWQHPEVWRRMGQQGRDYVRRTYGSQESFAGRLLESIHELALPLAERMRRQGFLRAAGFERSVWRERFGHIVEELLDRPPRPKREQLEVRPRTTRRVASAGSGSTLVPVRIANRGTHAALSEGPGRVLLRSLVTDEFGQPCGPSALDTPLPGLLIPGQEAAAAMRVSVPAAPGMYRVAIFAVPPWEPDEASVESSLRLIVEPAAAHPPDPCCAVALQAVQQALAEAEGKQRLPVEYLDVTQGFLAKWKRWFKRKLLGNFKHAYVDVLSRQQSAFNRQTLTALQELTECCALLDHALATSTAKMDELMHQLAEAEQRVAVLEARLAGSSSVAAISDGPKQCRLQDKRLGRDHLQAEQG